MSKNIFDYSAAGAGAGAGNNVGTINDANAAKANQRQLQEGSLTNQRQLQEGSLNAALPTGLVGDGQELERPNGSGDLEGDTRASKKDRAIAANGNSILDANLRAWTQAMQSMRKKMVIRGLQPHSNAYFLREAKAGQLVNRMQHLSCFAPAMLIAGYYELPPAVRDSRWKLLALQLADTCYQMYASNFFGLACETTSFRMKAGVSEGSLMSCAADDKQYHLRPELFESLYYLYYYTGHRIFQRRGYELFLTLRKYAKAPFGYAATDWSSPISNITSPGKMSFRPKQLDKQESYFPSETLKYLYLLFQPRKAFDLEEYVFNTNGHPLGRFKEQTA